MMRQINLFNPALLPKKHHFSSSTLLQALVAIVLGSILLLWFATAKLGQLQKQVDGNAKQMATLEAQLKKINAELTPRQKDPKLAEETAQLERQWQDLQQLQSWLKVNTLGNTEGYASLMTGLARQRIDGLWLTGFEFGDAGKEVSLQGRAMQAALIPTYVQKLATEASFKGRTFSGMEIKQPLEPAKIAGSDAQNNSTQSEKVRFNPTAGGAVPPATSESSGKDSTAPQMVKTAYVEFSLTGAPRLAQANAKNSSKAPEKNGVAK